MNTSMDLNWLVKPVGFQSISKRCPGCETKKNFFPSGCFRVNAQKKMLDVWHIYKCEQCDYTWNIDIFSRVRVNRLQSDLYQGFLRNDIAMVQRYAFDYQVLAKNKARLGTPPDFIVEGPQPCSIPTVVSVQVKLQLEYPMPIRLSAILTKKMGVSHSILIDLVRRGAISGVPEAALGKKLKQGTLININVEKLHNKTA